MENWNRELKHFFKNLKWGNKGMKGWLTHVRECVLTFNIRPRESSHRKILLLFQEEGGFGEEAMGRMLVSLYVSGPRTRAAAAGARSRGDP